MVWSSCFTAEKYCQVNFVSNGSKLNLFRFEFVRFLFVGGFNTAFSLLIYFLLVYTGVQFAVSNFISLIAGIFVSYFLQKKLVFKSEQYSTIAKFIGFWFVMYLISSGIIFFAHYFGINYYLAGFLSTCLNVPLSYFISRRFIFNQS